MQLSFDPNQSYVEMLFQLSDEKLEEFFNNVSEKNEEDEVLLYDDEG